MQLNFEWLHVWAKVSEEISERISSNSVLISLIILSPRTEASGISVTGRRLR